MRASNRETTNLFIASTNLFIASTQMFKHEDTWMPNLPDRVVGTHHCVEEELKRF